MPLACLLEPNHIRRNPNRTDKNFPAEKISAAPAPWRSARCSAVRLPLRCRPRRGSPVPSTPTAPLPLPPARQAPCSPWLACPGRGACGPLLRLHIMREGRQKSSSQGGRQPEFDILYSLFCDFICARFGRILFSVRWLKQG